MSLKGSQVSCLSLSEIYSEYWILKAFMLGSAEHLMGSLNHLALYISESPSGLSRSSICDVILLVTQHGFLVMLTQVPSV